MTHRARDAAAATLLLVGTVGYLYHWPHDFYTFDEGLYLYEAKRVLDGEVMYRDFFDILTPGWFYFMALLYALFGVSIDTARIGMAVVHALIGALVYAICRQAGVRASLAMVAALAHITLAYPVCSQASPHWFGTFVLLVLTSVVVARPALSALRAAGWGALAGALVLVQQQKGAAAVAGVSLIIAGDHVFMRQRWSRLLGHGAAYAAGLVAVVASVMGAFILVAGWNDVLRALVWYPLDNYRRIHDHDWQWRVYFANLTRWRPADRAAPHQGMDLTLTELPDLGPLTHVVRYVPLALPVAAVTAIARWLTTRGVAPQRPFAVLLVMASCALLSAAYRPDNIHFSYVMAVWLPLVASLAEMLLRVVRRATPMVDVFATGIAVLLCAGAAWQLSENLRIRRGMSALPVDTRFGRIDVGRPDQVEEYQWLVDIIDREGVREAFTYPCSPGVYLMTGTTNPTRYQIVLRGYTDRDQLEEIVATLELRGTPYVIHSLCIGFDGAEPLSSYVSRYYRRVEFPLPRAPMVRLLRRRPDTAAQQQTTF
jgi:hypothetical protein